MLVIISFKIKNLTVSSIQTHSYSKVGTFQNLFLLVVLMTKIHAINQNPRLRLMVTRDIFDDEIECVIPVRRPLDVPSTMLKLGKVLSHSGCIVKTKNKGYLLVEYMSANQIFVSQVYNYRIGMKEFDFKKYHFTVDGDKPETPNKTITVREFALKMIDFTKDAPFDTFTHNCHHARYDTMRFYGMKSDNPDSGKYNMLYQGVLDYFGKT